MRFFITFFIVIYHKRIDEYLLYNGQSRDSKTTVGAETIINYTVFIVSDDSTCRKQHNGRDKAHFATDLNHAYF